MNTVGFDLIVDQDTHRKIAEVCAEILQHATTRIVLLVGYDGSIIARHGFTEDVDCDSLAALSAATYASTGQIASLIGESQFDTFYHQGRGNHILMSRVGEHGVVVAVFDERTTAGMVRLYLKDAVRRLNAIFAGRA